MERADIQRQPPPPFRVGEWVAEPMANQLSRGDTKHRVEPKVMEVLVCMARRPGETITKEEFMADVWAGTIVTDDVLARCISELRKTLGDSAQKPRFVKTIRKRGYRLIAPVERADVDPVTAFSSQKSNGDGSSTGEVSLADVRPQVVQHPAKRTRSTNRRIRFGILTAIAFAIGSSIVVQQYIVNRTKPLSITPVTSYPGEEMDPALSPDGRSIAFAWDGGEGLNFDLYVQPTIDEEPLRLTETSDDEHSPAWSPDGRQLAFARCTVSGCSIFAIPASGGEESLLAELRTLYVRDLVWSPDGRTLALSARQRTRGSFSLILLPLDTRRPLRLTESPASPPGDLDPAWSPDGRTLAFIRTTVDGRQDVSIVPSEGGEVRALAREQQGVTGLDWTSDGRTVVYAANREGASGLWRIGLGGGEPTWVALGDGGEVYQPSVARNARGITFAQRSYATNIALIDRTRGGASRTSLLIESTRWDSQPNVSADGLKIAFISNRSGSLEIWMADADGTNLRRLTSFGGPRVSTPRWSPDGSQIVFSSRVSGHADLYIVEPGSPPRRFTDDPGDEVAPSWSRDGSRIYFASKRNGDWQIWRRSVYGGETLPVTRYGGIAAEETPNGHDLMVVRPEKKNLWRVALDEELAEQNSVSVAPLDPADWANWTVREEGIYLVQRREDEASADVVLVNPQTLTYDLIATVVGLPEAPSLAVFPGGRKLLVTQTERSDSDIVLVRDFR